MKSKGQIGQIFIYVISALIIILVLYYGYGAIQNIGQKQQELSYVKFQTSMSDMISYTSSDYGTVRMEDFLVPEGYSEVCFVDPYLITTRDASTIPEAEYPLIYDSVEDGVRANIFVIPGGQPFYNEKIFIEDSSKFKCFAVVQGKISLRIEGLGDKAKIS